MVVVTVVEGVHGTVVVSVSVLVVVVSASAGNSVCVVVCDVWLAGDPARESFGCIYLRDGGGCRASRCRCDDRGRGHSLDDRLRLCHHLGDLAVDALDILRKGILAETSAARPSLQKSPHVLTLLIFVSFLEHGTR